MGSASAAPETPRWRIWVKSGPGNNSKIEISQIWVKYGPENSKNKTNHNLPTMFMLWRYVEIVFETIYPNMVREYWEIQKSIFLCSEFSDNGLSDWPPVEPLTAR